MTSRLTARGLELGASLSLGWLLVIILGGGVIVFTGLGLGLAWRLKRIRRRRQRQRDSDMRMGVYCGGETSRTRLTKMSGGGLGSSIPACFRFSSSALFGTRLSSSVSVRLSFRTPQRDQLHEKRLSPAQLPQVSPVRSLAQGQPLSPQRGKIHEQQLSPQRDKVHEQQLPPAQLPQLSPVRSPAQEQQLSPPQLPPLSPQRDQLHDKRLTPAQLPKLNPVPSPAHEQQLKPPSSHH
ncbi:hypothetical protein GQ602_005318 [Ophiocordyceps camponoti-floridani]|uniref:Uncharacterized protein n=1 Tax=Ophiocordyceps camponoti-floridani TaxID=2030778 RepID=A0A8H4Q5E6_9HYPO|nr:hypothetical protein GQ602_005318 [Ophiocordyceps camponoti-floridani]